ncbi:hypothetical protein [Arenibacter sp. ARW7G5Y1]|uniref:hypothetical protein n=1 Tax=Arenibacter sp. ARW7G5Y1 TaxID=2135619 RepID=UPI000D751DEC|nr:hypothetical protein [Arenibacter sp. ARW7G5Y1]PXX25909.1 hypothetical protein C7972_11032 [Arenibacter sp. ARW7G5Y1]|tara:strand:- start:560 stop:916 length:357 start_codon:yes stop_codon:yes gene_type:complete
MVVNFPNISALLKHAKDQSLYQDLVSQLQKDFVFANVFIELPDNIPPKDLKTLVHEKVYYLIMEKFTDYLNLLYIIDVPEKAVKAIETTDVVEISEQVTFEILKREWQKVWFRNKYGS